MCPGIYLIYCGNCNPFTNFRPFLCLFCFILSRAHVLAHKLPTAIGYIWPHFGLILVDLAYIHYAYMCTSASLSFIFGYIYIILVVFWLITAIYIHFACILSHVASAISLSFIYGNSIYGCLYYISSVLEVIFICRCCSSN